MWVKLKMASLKNECRIMKTQNEYIVPSYALSRVELIILIVWTESTISVKYALLSTGKSPLLIWMISGSFLGWNDFITT